MTQIQPLNKGLAIVIGINKYTNGIPTLKNAVNDAKKVAEMLQTKYDYQVLQLLDEAATLSRIKELLAAIKQQQIPLNNHTVKIEENHRIFFYFAGHGIALDGLEDARGPQGFLVPQDGKLNEEKILLPMTELHDALIALPCRHLLVVLDCCFAGSFRWAGLNRNAARSQKLYREKYERFTNSKAQQVITSAAYDEKALDSIYRLGKRGEIDGHSPFAEVLLKGLEGEADYSKDGAITANELYLYLQTELDKQKVTQNPGICYLKNHEKGEYIFPVPGFNPNSLDNAPPLSDDNNPYRGLASFDEIHQGLFFGRQGVIEDLYRVFNDNKKTSLTAVLGASGTGKSSLVKAGLLPRLREDRWYIVNLFRPGKSPFSALAAAMFLTVLTREVSLVKTRFFESLNATNYGSVLAWQGFLDIGEIFQKILAEYNDQKIVDSLSDFLREKPKLLTKVAGIGHSKVPEKLLLVIDQFEELVTDCPAEEKDKFLGWLEEILRDNSGKVRVIITLRSDFKAQFTSELLDEKVLQFTVPMMTQDEYREVIEKPATEKVLYFEPPELVDELINEVVQMPGALPLLSFTLSQLYFRCCDRWQMGEKSRAMTREDYQKLGGVMGALKRTTTDVFEKLIKEKKATEQTIRDVMLRMVAVSGDELARRRVPMWELVYPEPKNGEVEEVLNAFTTARLLVKGATADGEEYVEPAHDALVTGWDKILKWKNQEQESLLLQRRLTPAAMEWKEKQSGRFLWNANPYLDVLKKVLKSDDNWFNEVEQQFVGRSIIKRRKNVCLFWGSVSAVMMGLMGFSGFIFIQGLNGKIQGMNVRSEELFNSHNQLDALRESLKAARQLKWVFGKWSWGISQETKMKTIARLQQTLYYIKEQNRLQGHTNGVNSVVFSPNGQILASASDDKDIMLWSLDGSRIGILKGHEGEVWSLDFNRDGTILASIDEYGMVKLWNVADRTNFLTLDGKIGDIRDVSFSPNGQLLATAGSDKTVKLWNVNGSLVTTLKGHTNGVMAVSFSKNGKVLASASSDTTVKLWNVDTGECLSTFEEHKERVNSVNFSPDGNLLASADRDGIIKIWNASDRAEKRSWQGHIGPINHISFNSHGKLLVSTGQDRTLKIWKLDDNVEKKEPEATFYHRAAVWSANFSPDNNLIASGSSDETIKLWNLDDQKSETIKGESEDINKASFSADGKILITQADYKTLELWNLKDNKSKIITHNSEYIFYDVNLSQSGQILAISMSDKNYNNYLYILDVYPLFNQRNKTIKININNNRVIRENKKLILDVSFSAKERFLAYGLADSTIKMRSLDGRLYQTPFRGNTQAAKSLSFSPIDSQLLASGSADGTVRLFSNNGEYDTNSFMQHNSEVNIVNFSPDGQWLASANQRTIKLRNLNNNRIFIFNGHSSNIKSIKFKRHKNHQLFASASRDETVKLWSINDEIALMTFREHSSPVLDVSFSADDKTLISVSEDNTILQRNMDLDDLLMRGCDWLKDYLKQNFPESLDKKKICDKID